jgi:LuxR family maltose regulon positive regulatory protein
MERHLTRPVPLTELAAVPTLPTPGTELVWTKLVPPAPRAGLIARAGLQSMLQIGLEAELCLLDAPAGSGKTTLLAQWCATVGVGRVAWVSLDEGDNSRPCTGPALTTSGWSCRRCSTT